MPNPSMVVNGEEMLLSTVVEAYVCEVCHSPLKQIWGKDGEEDRVECYKDPNHKGLLKSNTAYYRDRKEALRMSDRNTALVPADQGQEVAEWAKRLQRLPLEGANDMVEQTRYAAARFAVLYGLDPFLGEVVLIPSKKNNKVVGYSLYATIGGMRRAARRTKHYDGRKLRPATEEERADLKITDEKVHVWHCEVWRKDTSRSFEGFGIFPLMKQDLYESAPPGNLMAMKRAEHRALRAAFGLNIPLFEEGKEEEPPLVFARPPQTISADAIADAQRVVEDLIRGARQEGLTDEAIVIALERGQQASLEEICPETGLTAEEIGGTVGIASREAEIAAELEAAPPSGIAVDEERRPLVTGELPPDATVAIEVEITPADQPEEAKKEPEEVPEEAKPPSLALYWRLANENDVELEVSNDILKAAQKEGKPIIEAIEALRAHIVERDEKAG